MNPNQREQYRRLIARLPGRDRKELSRRAATERSRAQKDPDNPRTRWDIDRWALHLLEAETSEGGPTATVVQLDKGRAAVRRDGQEFVCDLVREIAMNQQGLLAPGDEVRLTSRGDRWTVSEVLPRRTCLTRPPSKVGGVAQTVVANVDVVAIVVSVVAPPLHTRIIDRYLAAIYRGGAAPMIVLNKIDLHESEPDLQADWRLIAPYEEQGISVFGVSTETGEGVERLRQALAGQTSVFVGHSGVGKSSLVNAVTDQALAVAGEVGATGRGQHTTTRSELIEIDGMRIIDTPGIRAFAVEFKSRAEIAECFTEFGTAGRCRFGDCAHLNEPGCAVRAAVNAGAISKARYFSYRRLVGEG